MAGSESKKVWFENLLFLELNRSNNNTIQVGIRTIPQYQGSFKNESVGGKSNKVLK